MVIFTRLVRASLFSSTAMWGHFSDEYSIHDYFWAQNHANHSRSFPIKVELATGKGFKTLKDSLCKDSEAGGMGY
jgi:hypothetical protein